MAFYGLLREHLWKFYVNLQMYSVNWYVEWPDATFLCSTCAVCLRPAHLQTNLPLMLDCRKTAQVRQHTSWSVSVCLSVLLFHTSFFFSLYNNMVTILLLFFFIIMNIFSWRRQTWVSFWLKCQWREWTDIRPEELLLMYLQCTFCYKHRHKNQKAQ